MLPSQDCNFANANKAAANSHLLLAVQSEQNDARSRESPMEPNAFPRTLQRKNKKLPQKMFPRARAVIHGSQTNGSCVQGVKVKKARFTK